jgi:UDP-glucose 4-epimerase
MEQPQGLVPGPWTRYVVIGGAGFIGGHFVDRLLGDPRIEQVTVYDNFSSGREWHLAPHRDDPRFTIVRRDVSDLESLVDAVSGHQVAIHLASNPDIALAATEPAVDFDQGTALTHHVAEAARRGGLIPVSTYGASKLAGEALLASYCAMFGLSARAFRFGNVVGPRQTHGVGFDFLRRLRKDPSVLDILGDGTQSKSYVHVFDVIDAVLLASASGQASYEVFNVAAGDYITVREIAELAVSVLGLEPGSVSFAYTGGDRGWKGDVPIVRIATDRIRSLGWSNRWSSAQALERAIRAMVDDAEVGRLT